MGWVGHGLFSSLGGYFSLPSTQTLLLHPEVEAREGVRGPVVRGKQSMPAAHLRGRGPAGGEAGPGHGR